MNNRLFLIFEAECSRLRQVWRNYVSVAAAVICIPPTYIQLLQSSQKNNFHRPHLLRTSLSAAQSPIKGKPIWMRPIGLAAVSASAMELNKAKAGLQEP